MKLNGNLDLAKGELQNVRLQNLASDPSTPVVGQAYFNTVSNKIRTWNGSTWDEMGTGSAGYTPGGTDVAITDGGTGVSTLPSGILKGAGTSAITAATAGTDYLEPAGSGASLTGITVGQVSGAAPLASPTFTGTPTAPTPTAGDNDTSIATTAFVTAAVAAGIGANDALVFKGGIDASTNPNYPAATSAGELWRITVAGKIGGASGIDVRAGDTITAAADGLSAGDQAAVGASWIVTQGNLDAATDTSVGFVELATVAEADAHSDSVRAVTPASLVNHTRKYAVDFGDASATSFTITHNLNTKDVTVDVRLNATDAREMCDVVNATVNTVTLSGWSTAPASNAYRCVVIG